MQAQIVECLKCFQAIRLHQACAGTLLQSLHHMVSGIRVLAGPSKKSIASLHATTV